MILYQKMRNDFEEILSIVGQSVTRTPITKDISNSYGDATITKGTSETINVSINRQNTKNDRERAGEYEDADVIMYTKYNQTINKDDEILYNSRDYKVKNVLNNIIDNKIIFKKCELYLIE